MGMVIILFPLAIFCLWLSWAWGRSRGYEEARRSACAKMLEAAMRARQECDALDRALEDDPDESLEEG